MAHMTACLMRLLMLCAVFFCPATAALVSFENCLPESYVDSSPTPLQWIPLFVDASFVKTDDKHTLSVTMWGNVTGSATNAALLPSGSNGSYWDDPNETNGKIVNEPDHTAANPKLTTLRSRMDVLNYNVWTLDTSFCNTSLTNATCPLAPVFSVNLTDISLPADLWRLPSVTMSQSFFTTYAFTSFTTAFFIVNGDQVMTDIGCVSATLTPELGYLSWVLRFLPLLILLIVGFATLVAAIYSPSGSTDVFHWTSNFGRDPDLLRLVTPGFGDCLQYIQYVVLTGGLTLSYPGFYQPIVSQASWSVLMFNQSLVSGNDGYSSAQDGLYVTNGTYGLEHLAQLDGMADPQDIWAGMIVWLLVIIAGVTVLAQLGFVAQWIYRMAKRSPAEDLRSKNMPFSLGNVVRIALNYCLLPVVALSTFQLVVASQSPAYTVALAALTLGLLVGFAAWLLHLIANTRPRAHLFDDLPTVLLYGPLYNTYSDEAAAFALIPFLCTFVKGIALGAIQPSGVAQVVVLAICEVVQIMTLHAFRPFQSPTSMNAFHTLFCVVRLITILLMVAFIPSLGVTDGAKGWIGYSILVAHVLVLVLAFLLNAIQTTIEVMARMLGAGNDNIKGLSRGGLSKIFGMRQLQGRVSRSGGPSRQSQLSSIAMLDADETSKPGFVMPSGRVRSESAGSMSGLRPCQWHPSSSAPDTYSLDMPMGAADCGTSSFTPGTFSSIPSPTQARFPANATVADPYYRPPRQRRKTLDRTQGSADKTQGSWASSDPLRKRQSVVGERALRDAGDVEGQLPRSETPGPSGSVSGSPFQPRTDYATREVDFYYGVRGSRLNSDAPSRKLGTGPADPTGPMASAAGWFRNLLGGKSKDKGKGFEVVRSARMPPAMRAGGGDFDDEPHPAGIPVAMGVLRNGPIDSDDEDDGPGGGSRHTTRGQGPKSGLLAGDGLPAHEDDDDDEEEEEARRLEIAGISENPPALPMIQKGQIITFPARPEWSDGDSHGGDAFRPVPRQSSKRIPDHSLTPSAEPLLLPSPRIPLSLRFQHEQQPQPQPRLAPSSMTSRLPFQRSASSRTKHSGSSVAAMSAGTEDEPSPMDGGDGLGFTTPEEQPANFGMVRHKGSIMSVGHELDLLGSSAEVVDNERR